MKKVEKPDWSVIKPHGPWGDAIEKIIMSITDALNANADEADRTAKEIMEIVTEHEQALNRIDAQLQGKGFYPPGIVERVEALEDAIGNDDRLPAVEYDLAGIKTRLKVLEDQLSTFCPQTDNKTGENVYKSEPNEPITGHSPDAGKMVGSWICDKCGKDWGNGSRIGIPSDTDKVDFQCGDCGRQAVNWHQAQTVGKPAEVPTSSVHYRWCDVDETAPDPEEPKPYPEGEGNQSGVLKARQYYDADGAPIKLLRLVQTEPEWAVTQILNRDRLEAENKELRAEIELLHNLHKTDTDELEALDKEITALKADLTAARKRIGQYEEMERRVKRTIVVTTNQQSTSTEPIYDGVERGRIEFILAALGEKE